MATAYTSILKLALPVQGELSGTWGDVVNDNITSMVEEAIAGRAVINTWTANSHTLTSADGTTSESRCAMLEFTDTGTALTGDATVVCPTQPKIYICKNGAGQKVTIKTSAGTGVAIADGQTMFVFCDGTNVVEAVTSMSSLKLGTAATSVQVTAVLDEDDLVSDSATALATQQSIKAYVDAQVTAQDLDFGGDSGTGSVDLDSQTFTIAGTANEIETSASGQTLTVGLPAAVTVTTSVTTPLVQATNVNANDGSSAIAIADSTGQTTINDAVLTTADINGGTADNVVIGGTTAAAGSFTTVGATGNITSQGQVITDTINEQTATSGVTVDGVLLKDGGATLTSDLTVDTNTLYVDSTNNRVGIGTSSPTRLLDVNGEAKFSGLIRTRAGSATAASVGLDDDNTGLFQAGTNQIGFTVNGSEAMRIDSGGNVGIGTTDPVEPFTVGATTTAAGFSLNSTTTQVFLRYNNYFSGTSQVSDATKGSASISIGRSSDGIITFSTAAAGAGTPSEVMRITNSGNVGIGINNPQDFNGGANNLVVGTGSGSQGISIYAGASSNSSVFFVDGDSGTAEYRGQINYRHDVDDMSFHTAGGFERMRIDSSGNVGIGTTNPSGTLNVFTGGIGLRIDANAASGDAEINLAPKNASSGICNVSIVAESEENGLASALYFKTRTSGGTNTERMRIDSSGNVGIGVTDPVGRLEVKNSGDDNGFEFLPAYSSNINLMNSYNRNTNTYYPLENRASYFMFKNGTSEAMRIDSSGNVGIGTTSPNQLLTLGSSTANSTIGLDFETSNTIRGSILYDANAGELALTSGYSGYGGRIVFDANGSERMRIDSSGRVGIGTSSPDTTTLLTVDGAMTLLGQNSGHGASRLKLGQDTTAISQIRFYGADNSTPGILQFTGSSADGTVGGERMRIDSSGNVGIGTSSPAVLSHVAAGYTAPTGGLDAGIRSLVSSTGYTGLGILSASNASAYVHFGDPDDSDVGGIIYGHSSNHMQFNVNASERMRIDSSGNVGIGTSSPSNPFEVIGSVDTNVATFSTLGDGGGASNRGISIATDTYGGSIRTVGSGVSMGFDVNGSERMRIDSSGNVGFGGVTSPQAGFGVSGCIDTNGAYFTRGQIASHQTNAAVLQYGGNLAELRAYGATAGSGEIRFMIGGGGGSADSEAVRIDNSGNLGIGQTSPQALIHGSISSVASIKTEVFRVSDEVLCDFKVFLDRGTNLATSVSRVNTASGIMAFETSNTERMRIDSSGKLLVGTTSSNSTGIIQGRHNNGASNAVLTTWNEAGSGTRFHMQFLDSAGGSDRGSITTNGSSTSFNTTSDHRLKENVVELTGATTRLKQLEPKRFNFIADADTTVDGFLAHEVQSIVPEAITGTHNEVDADGNPVYQGIDQSKLVPLLVATIKELEARITALENA